MLSSRISRGKAIVALAVLPFLVAGLAACGSADDSSSEDVNGSAPVKTMSYDEWQLAYAQCMRDEGVEMTDPDDGGISGGTGEESALAMQKCVTKLGESPAPPGGAPTEEQWQEKMLAAAACLRDNGFDVADPKDGFMMPPEGASAEVLEKCGVGMPGGGK